MTQPATTGSNYTQAEIQAVVQQLVLSTIVYPADSLGVRRTDLTFDAIQQAAANAFILYPNSPFYILQLGMQRLQDQVTAESAIIDSLLQALAVCGNPVTPIADVSPLFNVQAALQSLGGAAANRTAIYADITNAPAYQQFTANSAKFLNGPGQQVKQNGNIVQTPQQARASIPALMTQFTAAHTQLVATVNLLASGIANYSALNLPSVVITSVLSNAAALVGSDAAALQALTPTQRLAQLRQVVLNLLATQAVVSSFGSFSGPSDYYTLNGVGTPYSDATHQAVPALLTALIEGAVTILTGSTDQLSIAADGGAPVVVTLTASLIAELDGQVSDTGFIIGDGVSPTVGTGGLIPNNNSFELSAGGVFYSAPLTLSSNATNTAITGTGDTTTAGWYGIGGTLDGTTFSVTMDGLATESVTLVAPTNTTDLLTQMNSGLGLGSDVVLVTIVANRVVLTTSNTGSGASILIGSGSANAVLGFTAGTFTMGGSGARTADEVAADINAVLPSGVQAAGYYSPLKFDGLMNVPGATNPTLTLVVPGSSNLVSLGVSTTDTAMVVSGANAGNIYPITAVATNSITIAGTTLLQAGAEIQIGPKSRKLKIVCTNPAVQVPDAFALTVMGLTTAAANGAQTLGFVVGQSSSCQETTPDLVAANINAQTGTVTAGTTVNDDIVEMTTAHCDPNVTNPSLVVFSEAAAVGTTSFVGTVLTFTVTAITVAGLVSTGDTIALRSGPSPANGYVIQTINGVVQNDYTPAVGDVVVADGSFAGTGGTNVNVEFGPTLPVVGYQVVTITGGPNNGTYFTKGRGDTAIDVILIKTLPLITSQTSPTTGPATLTASFGGMYLTLSSKNTTTASKLVVSGDAASMFFSFPTTTQFGTTPWMQLPSLPTGLQAGDMLELYPTDYANPSFTYPIINVIPGLNLIELGPDSVSEEVLPSDESWQFTVQPVPFARLHYGISNDFYQTQAAMNTWLDLPENQPVYLLNLNALVNPLLVDTNPTAEQVGTATNALTILYAFLTTAQATITLNDPTLALQSILQTFTVEPVTAIDALIKTYTEKGADAAIDTLLTGDFETFFGMTAETSSYAGAFQAATRSVATNDLPVRKFNRPEAQSSPLTVQTQSPDLEYPASSVNETLPGTVDPPTSYGESPNYGTTTGSSGAGG